MNIIPWLSPTTIINRRGVTHFIKTYARDDNWHELDLATGNLGYGWVHYALLKTLKPSRVLCIGSKYGFVPAICALACRDIKKGVVDFVDAGYAEDSHDHWGGVGFWKHVSLEKHFGAFNLQPYIHVHITTTKEFTQRTHHNSWQYIYIDADHSYIGVKQDFQRFWPKLDRGGYLILHDIYADNTTMKELGSFRYGVKRFWNELKKQHPGSIEIPGRYGLGIIQKHHR